MKKITLPLLVLALVIILLPVNTVAAQPDKPVTPPQLKHGILIHYANPDVAPAKPIKPPAPTPRYDYYELLGPKWMNLPVSYVIDPDSGPAGAVAEIVESFEAWDDATASELFNDTVTTDSFANPSLNTPDGKNVVCFRMLPAYPTALAITSYWYDDTDGDGQYEMLDSDMIFNLKYKWGIDPDGAGPQTLPKNYYDVRNIGTHEAGHIVGLDDLYAATDFEMTMYGYGAARETKKITLEIGDINGCRALYGP